MLRGRPFTHRCPVPRRRGSTCGALPFYFRTLPWYQVQDPPILFQDPPILFQDPPILFQDPPILFQDPPILFQDPAVKAEKGFTDIQRCQQLQKELLLAAIDSCNAHAAGGGIVVYSTCSIAVEENEAVVE
eukprot:scaffold9881_cov94-Isochrysis_galbana.AAC.1